MKFNGSLYDKRATTAEIIQRVVNTIVTANSDMTPFREIEEISVEMRH